MGKFADQVNLARKLSLMRLWNATQVTSSYYVSKWRKKPVQWGLPMSLSMCLANAASTLLAMDELDRGLEYLNRAIKICRQTDDNYILV